MANHKHKYDFVKVILLIILIIAQGVFIFSKWQTVRQTATVYQAPIPKGIYVSLLGYDYPLQTSYAGTPVSGFDIYLNWSQLEPSYGTYSWTALDNDIAIAQAANKPYIIGVEAGIDAPSWIFQSNTAYGAGVTSVPISETRANGTSFNYNAPVPWNASYLVIWKRFITALAAHVQTESYQNLIGVQVTGINDATMETRLPGPNTSNPTSTAALWQSAGYTPNQVLSTWKIFAADWQRSFPSVQYMVTLIRPYGGFPLTDASGNPTIYELPDMDVAHNIAQQAISQFKTETTIMGTFLNGDGGNYGIEDAVTTALQGGSPGGYQLEENTYDDESRTVFSKPVDPQSSFKAALQQGVTSGATYFEIYPVDVQLFPTVLPTINSLLGITL